MTMYKKRSGTSGIRGHLYETKLTTSLIYFRAKHNPHIEEFHLATNVDQIGAFDDICFKVKFKDSDKPVAVFIQAKHRDNDKSLTLNNRKYLSKLFDSYITISRTFKPNKKDVLFEGNFNETECFFVLYTNEKGDLNYDTYKGSNAHSLDAIIGTGDPASQLSYRLENVEFLCEIVLKEQIHALAMQIAKFICDEGDCLLFMSDDLILRFHVILAQKVFNVSDIQPEGYRIASFRQEFFNDNEEELLVFFREILYQCVHKKQKFNERNINEDISIFLQEPTDYKTLSKLIGKTLKYNNGKLELVKKTGAEEYTKQQLSKVYVAEVTVNQAINIAARDILTSCQLKVPPAFGNKDLTIRGNEKKNEKRLNHITTKFVDLIEKFLPNKVVTIDKSLGSGFLQLNGGIGGTIGNIFIFDEETKLLKLTNNSEVLGNISKMLFEKFKKKIDNLHEYRFKINVENFPKPSFDYNKYEQNLTNDFLNKLLFYTNQADENGVEEILKNEILSQQSCDPNNLQIKSDVIFLKYHDEIQKWWMNPETAPYLTKQSLMYENILNDIIEELLIYFNEIRLSSNTSDTEKSESDTTSKNLVNELPNTDKLVKKIKMKLFFPIKLTNKVKIPAKAMPEMGTTSLYPIKEPERTNTVVAIYPYNTNKSGELSLETGDEYEVINNKQPSHWQVKNKHGLIGYIPRTCIMHTDIIECREYEWYVGEMTRKRAEFLLTHENKDRCFLVRYSSNMVSLVISLYNKGQQKTLHYIIVQNSSGEYHIMKEPCFKTVPELIKYYKYNEGIPLQLTTTSSLAKWDIDPSQLVIHEVMYRDWSNVVWRGRWRNYINIQYNTIIDSSTPDENLLDEANVMAKLQHNNLVQLYGVCFKDHPIHLVTEYFENGSLNNYLRSEHLTTTKLMIMCIQVCKGMTYLVRNNYIHRAVEACNCFVGANNLIKLGNFGMTRYAPDDQYIGRVGTVNSIQWASPEVINETLFCSKSDVWSFAVLMWEVFSGCKVPFDGRTKEEVINMVVNKCQVLEKPSGCSDEIYEVMRACWNYKPNDRPSFPALLNRLIPLC